MGKSQIKSQCQLTNLLNEKITNHTRRSQVILAQISNQLTLLVNPEIQKFYEFRLMKNVTPNCAKNNLKMTQNAEYFCLV